MNDDLIDQAGRIVDNCVELVEALVEARRVQTSGRFICRCTACRYQREHALAWVRAMRAPRPFEERQAA